jgi:acetyl esterase/lipase
MGKNMKTFFNPTIHVFFLSIIWIIQSCSDPVKSDPAPGLNEYSVTKNVEWAKPDGHSLTMDIYVPQTGKSSYPVIIIYHGGGWLINNKSVMDSMSIYLVRHSEYIVCNVNYRLLTDQSNTVKMNQIIEDVVGAVLWVRKNISAYQGDPTRLIVTGDSAGGHLAEMVVLCGNKLESDGFAGNSLGYKPTYLPPGMTAEQVVLENGLDIQAAILSYAAFNLYSSCLAGFETSSNFFWMMAGATPRGIFGDSINVQNNPNFYQAVSPSYNIPLSPERVLPPQLCMVGSNDNLITPASVQNYVSSLQQNGHSAEYWEHAGRPHAFLDSGKNDFLGTKFSKDAPPAIDRMIQFLDHIFYQ